MNNLAQGLHENVPASDYHADSLCAAPTFSRSCATVLLTRSPAHAWLGHPRLGGKPLETNKVMDRGSVIHELMLGEGSGIAVAPYDSWRTNDAKAFREAAVAEGKTAILEEAFQDARNAADGLRFRLKERGFAESFDRAKSEVTAIFTDNDVLCRARFDKLEIEPDLFRAAIWDLKIVDDASRESCERKIGSMHYALQEYWYRRSIEVVRPDLAGRIGFVFLFCEPEPPYAIRAMSLSGAWREIGGSQYRRSHALWKKCLADKRWPAFEGAIEYAEPKPWDMTELST